MARFRATILGNRGQASRLGSEQSGIKVTADGWNNGVQVDGHPVEGTSRDHFYIHSTGGSNNRRSMKLLGSLDGDGNFTPSDEVRRQIIDEYLGFDTSKVDAAGQVWSKRLGRYLPYSRTR